MPNDNVLTDNFRGDNAQIELRDRLFDTWKGI
ncbi:hypothetical protein BSE24067_00609 [Burkholderia seminalis]|nr:hypothetical protein BSE24067_00609 [Burkholderia seminalis]